MSYKTPTRRMRKNKDSGLNLIPILDSVFIFIFFLLMSAQFVKLFEIGSDVPIISNSPPPKNKKKPLALTLKIKNDRLEILTGVPGRVIKRITKEDEKYNLLELHDYMIQVKKKNMDEETIILEPIADISYEELVQIMDAVRQLNTTDESLYKKDADGLDVKEEKLFSKIVFGNLMS